MSIDVSAAAPAAPRTRPGPPLGFALGLVALVQLIVSLDYNIVYVALPAIGHAVDLDAHTLPWVVSAYALAFGGGLLLGGRACDLVGPRRTLVLGLTCYGVGSLAGGSTGDAAVLIAARGVQGVGGAFLFPATLTLIGVLFAEGRARRRAFAVWGTAGGSGMILGSLLGGVLTAHLGWSSVFLVNVPLVALALLGTVVLVPRRRAGTDRRKVDVAGAVTSTLGVVTAVYAIQEAPAAGWGVATIIAAVAAPIALVAFVVIERRSRDPLLPLRLFRDRDLRAGTLVTFGFMGTFGALLYFLTVYFQAVQGLDAMATGLAFLPPMVAIVLGSQATTDLIRRCGHRATMIVSCALGVTGSLLLAGALTADASYLSLLPGLLVLGLGQGAGYTAMFGGAVVGIAPEDRGVASGIASTSQQMGGAVGLAVLVSLAATRLDQLDGIELALVAASIGMVATGVAALGHTGHRDGRAR